jgi:UPF0755 protein
MTQQGPPPPPNGRKVGIVEGWEIRHDEQRQANSGAWKGLFFVIGLLAVLVVGGWLVARPVIGPVLTGAFIDNPGLVKLPVVAGVLDAEFADRVNAPAGTSLDEVRFTVAQGDHIETIRDNLVRDGLLTDAEAFTYEMVKGEKDGLVQAGRFTMTPQFSPAQIVSRLTAPPDPEAERTTLGLRAGWRLEQIVAYLQQEKERVGLELDVAAFRDLARKPPSSLVSDYNMLDASQSGRPKGNSLEGFLAGGVYEVPVDITADEMLRKLLDEWEKTNGDLIPQARRAKVDFYEALRIAALVEREIALDKERPLVAGVYWNRIDPKVNRQTAGLMQADPTVVYAADTQKLADTPLRQWDEYLFWATLGVDLNTVDLPNRYSSFQTYRNTGLPDWPITTPTRASLQAAIKPNTKKKHLFFVSCPGKNKHTFSRTVVQHNRNVRKCGLPV